MKSILIANIGNRNVKYKGKFISNYLHENKDSSVEDFRSFTRAMLDNLIEYEKEIEPVILTELLHKKRDEVVKVILVSSDMEGIEERINQDTIFLGEILCKILGGRYPGIRFENFTIRCSIYNHDKLTKCYRELLGNIKKSNEYDKLIYCDAGGTSQQKFVSKVLLEYMFEPEMLEPWYVKQTEYGQSELVPSEINEYRRIIDLEQIKILVNNSEYYAALSLGKELITEEQKMFIEFMYYRFNLAHENARKLANKLLNQKKLQIRNNPLLIETSQVLSTVNHKEFLNFLTAKDFYILREMLVLAKRCESLNRFSHCILTYNHFIEHFLHATIKKMGFDTRKYYKDLPVSEIYEKFPNVMTKYKRINTVSVPVQIEMAMHTDDGTCRSVLELISHTNSFYKFYSDDFCCKDVVYLDSRRNKFAHEGKMVTKEEYYNMPYLADLNEICKIFSAGETGHFEALNELIINNL